MTSEVDNFSYCNYRLEVPRTADYINYDYDIRNFKMIVKDREEIKYDMNLLMVVNMILYAANQDNTYNSSKN